MRGLRALVVVALAAAWLGGTPGAGRGSLLAAARVAPEDVAVRIDAYLSSQELAHHFSGAVVMTEGRTVLLSKGYGWADGARQFANTAHTLFPYQDQQIAALDILKLEDAGKLRQADLICRYLPHCPASWATITIAQLLSGTSGLHDYFNDTSEGTIQGTSLSLSALVDHIARAPLDGTPGHTCCAWNADLPVEELIAERESGLPIGTLICSALSLLR